VGDNIDTIKKNVSDASKEVGLEINVEETKYMLLSRHQNAGQNRDMKVNGSSENVEQFQIFGNNSNKSKFYKEEIMRRLNSGNAFYHSVQNMLLLVCYLKT
jgi:hypothetical protein